MKALKRFKDGAKRVREQREWTRNAMKIFLLADAAVLHRREGYGKGRCKDHEAEVLSVIDGAIDRYGGDCIETALEHMCGEFGYSVEVEQI